jgi:hypothetical protein
MLVTAINLDPGGPTWIHPPQTLNPWVQGSSPWGRTDLSRRSAAIWPFGILPPLVYLIGRIRVWGAYLRRYKSPVTPTYARSHHRFATMEL